MHPLESVWSLVSASITSLMYSQVCCGVAYGLTVEIYAVNGRFPFDFLQTFSSPAFENEFRKKPEGNRIVYILQNVNELELPNIKLPRTDWNPGWAVSIDRGRSGEWEYLRFISPAIHGSTLLWRAVGWVEGKRDRIRWMRIGARLRGRYQILTLMMESCLRLYTIGFLFLTFGPVKILEVFMAVCILLSYYLRVDEDCFVVPVDIWPFKALELAYPDTEAEHEEYCSGKHVILSYGLKHDLTTLFVWVDKIIIILFAAYQVVGTYRPGNIATYIVPIYRVIKDLI